MTNQPTPKPLAMSHIKGITTLEQLTQYDELFRSYAYKMCEDFEIPTDFADDLVNDMYIKVNKSFVNDKIINGGYIVRTLKNLFINHCDFEKKRLKRNLIIGEHIPEIEYDISETIEEKMADEKLYEEMEERIESLNWYEKSILKISQTTSLLQLSKDSKISYKSLIYSKRKINSKLGITKNKTE